MWPVGFRTSAWPSQQLLCRLIRSSLNSSASRGGHLEAGGCRGAPYVLPWSGASERGREVSYALSYVGGFSYG